jgi:hypothetical protein
MPAESGFDLPSRAPDETLKRFLCIAILKG